ncbi:sensor histidine kinase [Pseudoalteromonas aliena]|uniref:sensor histidine kinase n=1 Tax=Pseudoalteromonas aliena TaxID=247523 RepID=UPI002493F714|nr:ATP-binding protein [Pseudoalteromonas aliena]
MNGSDSGFEQAFLNEQKKRLAAESLLKDKSRVLVAINNELQKKIADLEYQQKMFIQTEKMATLGTLCAGVAHEINNPLAYAMSNIEGLQQVAPNIFALLELNDQYLKGDVASRDYKIELALLNERQRFSWIGCDLLEQIDDSVEGLSRIKHIVHNLLNFAHPSISQDKQQANVIEAANNALKLLSSQLKLCKIKTHFDSVPSIICNLSSINQIFVNLLMNASQAYEFKNAKNCVIEVNVFEVSGHICIEVKDNGCGMSEYTQAHMFDPFYTTKDIGQGTGMGMTLVYAMVRDHHGTIEVNSVLDEGTSIRCLLPIKTEAS